MSKKRNCRRTPEEVSIHEEAVKLRKMTDAQLVEKVRSALNATSNASAAFDELGKTANRTAELLEAFTNANIPGIGKVTVKKLTTFAKENGYI